MNFLRLAELVLFAAGAEAVGAGLVLGLGAGTVALGGSNVAVGAMDLVGSGAWMKASCAGLEEYNGVCGLAAVAVLLVRLTNRLYRRGKTIGTSAGWGPALASSAAILSLTLVKVRSPPFFPLARV